YAAVEPTVIDHPTPLVDWLARANGLEVAVFVDRLYTFTDREAVSHLCRVAAGLDSLVLGEPQILGQVTVAYTAAVAQGSVGPQLSLLFCMAIRAGKRARTETAIAHQPVSLSSLAIALAQELVGDLRHGHILVIGLGEMGQLALKALRARKISQVSVASRSRPRAEAVAAPGGYQAYGLEELPQALTAADVVISATGASQPIVDAALAGQVMAQRPERRLILIDLAVPRDVDPAVRALPGVVLFNVDDLQQSLDDALASRQQAVPQVEAIIAQEVAAWEAEYQAQTIRPLISDLRHKAERIRQREVQRTLRQLGEVDPQTLAHLQRLSRSLVNKLLHEPTVRLRQKAADGQAADYANTVRDLFGLAENDGK
ncbi:MAG: glutamyl-tRNA reductase, partial [Candidatus Promineifilaceae bacterium]